MSQLTPLEKKEVFICFSHNEPLILKKIQSSVNNFKYNISTNSPEKNNFQKKYPNKGEYMNKLDINVFELNNSKYVYKTTISIIFKINYDNTESSKWSIDSTSINCNDLLRRLTKECTDSVISDNELKFSLQIKLKDKIIYDKINDIIQYLNLLIFN